VPHSPGEHFCPHNYQDRYAGINPVEGATITSDNSVYAQLGLDYVGTNKIARVAHQMGIRTPLSRNPAMVLGGLQEGVTPLEMAYAYSTLANDGVRVWGSLGPTSRSPVAIEKVQNQDGHIRDVNHIHRTRVIPYGVAEQAKSILAKVIQMGTGTEAQIGEFAAGKTGTTENYGDAWFVGFNKDLTVAVWVGYPDRLKPMLTEYRGGPVAGGTYPAEIWHDFMTAWIKMRDARAVANGKKPAPQTTTAPVAPVQATTAPTTTAPAQTTTQTAPKKTQQQQPTQQQQTQTQQQQAPPQQPPPQQQPQPPPSDGGGGTSTGTQPPPATQPGTQQPTTG